MVHTIVTFYTPDYEQIATRLKNSCHKFGYKTFFVEIKDSGSWEKNCAQKANFCLNIARDIKEPFIFLDSDCIVKKTIKIDKNYDLALTSIHLDGMTRSMDCIKWRQRLSEFNSDRMWNSGFLYINPTPSTIKTLERWKYNCESMPNSWDQVELQRAHREIGECKVDIESNFREYVTHHSQSRKLKRSSRWLVMGSAPYMPEWWQSNKHIYTPENGWTVAAMNNSWQYCKDECVIWFKPSNFNMERPIEPGIYWNEDWIKKPIKCSFPTTMVLTVTTIANICESTNKLADIHVAGSSYIYNQEQTHFYQGGRLDPLRLGVEKLKSGLDKMKLVLWSRGHSVKNIDSDILGKKLWQ